MSRNPKPSAGSPHSWFAHAKSDLRITELCRADDGVLPNQTAFHAQQAAEKAIKAVLLKHQIRFPRTHDLAALIALIEGHSVVWLSLRMKWKHLVHLPCKRDTQTIPRASVKMRSMKPLAWPEKLLSGQKSSLMSRIDRARS
jgi:hypothetical protein